MMRAQGGVPHGYTQYDWVQADDTTGSPAINTGLYLNFPYATKQHRYTLNGKFAKCGNIPNSWNIYFILTNSAETYDSCISLLRADNKTNKIAWVYQTYFASQVVDIAIINGEWHTFLLSFRDDDSVGGKLILDGVTYSYTSSTGNATNKPLYLLGYPSNKCFPCRLAELEVYEFGQMIADFVPAMRDADGVVGFYDVVRKMFCTPSVDGVQLLCGYGLDNF